MNLLLHPVMKGLTITCISLIKMGEWGILNVIRSITGTANKG
jgi:hypothetical protein